MVEAGAGTRQRARARGLTLRFALLTGMAVGLVGISALIQELQAASTAWIVGQSHWSRAQQQAVASLHRYLESGHAADLQQARTQLDVPLADLQARQALERQPPDTNAARAAFLRGGNARGDVNRLILSYRYGRDLAYFREASQLWRETDSPLLEIAAISNELEQRLSGGAIPAQDAVRYERRLQQLDLQLQDTARRFSLALVNMSALVRMTTLVVGALSVVAIAIVAVLLARRVRIDLMEQETRFRAAFYQASVGMLKIDSGGGLMEVNQALSDLLQRPREQLVHMHLRQLLAEGELVLDGEGEIDWPRQLEAGELRFLRADGSLMWGRWSGTAVHRGKQGTSIFAIVEDVTQNHVLARQVQHHASHDVLTGLINRREIERQLELALQQVRHDGGVHALCHLNLDHFKLVNEAVGHAAGDQMLRAFAEHLKGAVREGDWVGRLGADEFAVFLAGASQEEARRVLQRVIRTLGQASIQFGDDTLKISCSVGVVEVRTDTPDVNWLMGAADSACYAAKQGGRNRVHCFNEDRLALDEHRGEAERLRRVSHAIADGRMLLYAQRIATVGAPDYLHYEVLVRMRDEQGVLHGPGEFIGAVERYGMGMSLDRCVLSMLFRHLQVCPAHVARLGLCNVNVSAQSIAEPGFLTFVNDLLERNRTLAKRLCFEITETAVISNLAQAREFIDAVKARGCRIALDDFGSGLSSFAYLRQLSADLLKIDGTFVRDMQTDPVSRATVRAIAALGRELQLEVIAEWVETEEQAAQLVEMGVQGLQGYAIERPQPLERITQTALHPVRHDTHGKWLGRG